MRPSSTSIPPLQSLALTALLALFASVPGCCYEQTSYEGTPKITPARNSDPSLYFADSTSAGFVQFSPRGEYALLSYGNRITIADEGQVVEKIDLRNFGLQQDDGRFLSGHHGEPFSYSNSQFSPTAPEIALSLYPDTSYQFEEKNIYTYNWRKSKLQKITTLPNNKRATHPVYSPDGTNLAYVVRSDSMKPRIRIQPVDQPAPSRTLTTIDDPSNSAPFAFSPDGSYVLHSKSRTLQKTTLDTRTTRSLMDNPVYPSHIVFSPDGSRIAFLSKPKNKPESIYVLNTNTGGQRQLTPYGDVEPDSVQFLDLHFVSNSNTLVFARRKTEPSAKFQIHRYDLERDTNDLIARGARLIARGASPRIPGTLSSSVLAAAPERSEVLYVSESVYTDVECTEE